MLSCKSHFLSTLFFGERDSRLGYFKPVCFILFIIIMSGVATGCRTHGSKAAKQKKTIEKRMAEKQEKQVVAYKNAKERHRKIQSAGGKQLLSESDRHSQSLDKRQGRKKRFFLWRWLFKDDSNQAPCRN